jgi:hypothetical protein
VGVAVHAGGSGSADALLRASDADMYRHKKRTPLPPRLGEGPRPPHPSQARGGTRDGTRDPEGGHES